MINSRARDEDEKKNEITINTNYDGKSNESTIHSPTNSELSDCSGDNSSNLILIESCPGSPKKKNSIKEFDLYDMIGKGSYAKVYLTKNIHTNKSYALKIIDKLFLAKQNKEHEVHIEKFMLSNLNHPNIIKMHSTFQDNKKLYFVLEYCPNKDLSDLIKSSGRLNLETTKFYSAQIILALEYMHSKGIYHRDLKPENILLDENLNLKLCDFATANIKGMYFDQEVMKFKNIEEIKQLEYDSNNDTNQEKDFEDLIGTAEYVSPELLSCGDIGPAVDLWALGCIIFTALHGRTPFKDTTNFLTFNKILSNKYSMEENLEEDAKDIINKLLILDPIKRLGCGDNDSENDFLALKHHNFFKSIDWDKINIAAPFIKLEQNGLSNHLLSPIKRSSDHLKKSNLSVSSNSSAENSILSSISFDDFSPFKVKLLNINDKNNGNILFQSIVQKKSPWFHYNTRLLKLRTNGTLEYYDPKGHTFKGIISLTPYCKVELIDDYEFHLITTNRNFIFKVKFKFAAKWVEKINLVIDSLKF